MYLCIPVPITQWTPSLLTVRSMTIAHTTFVENILIFKFVSHFKLVNVSSAFSCKWENFLDGSHRRVRGSNYGQRRTLFILGFFHNIGLLCSLLFFTTLGIYADTILWFEETNLKRSGTRRCFTSWDVHVCHKLQASKSIFKFHVCICRHVGIWYFDVYKKCWLKKKTMNNGLWRRWNPGLPKEPWVTINTENMEFLCSHYGKSGKQ